MGVPCLYRHLGNSRIGRTRRVQFPIFSKDLDGHEIDVLARRLTDKANAVSVGVFQIHLAIAPGLIRRLEINVHILLQKLIVQLVHVVHNNVDNTPRNPIT